MSAKNPKKERFLKHLFDKSVELQDTKSLDLVKEHIVRRLDSLSASEQRSTIVALNEICKKLGIGGTVKSKQDVQRIVLASSRWSYLLRAFAMEMSSDENSRKRWKEVEGLARMPKDDVFKIADFFDDYSSN